MTTASPAVHPAPLGAPHRPRHRPARRPLRTAAHRHGLRAYAGYRDQALRDVFGIPGWSISYVVGLAVISELAALFPLPLVSDRWQPLRPRNLARRAWTASAVTVVGALRQIAVAFTVESQTYLANGPAQTVWALTFAPSLAIPALMTAVTWSYVQRHRVRAHARPRRPLLPRAPEPSRAGSTRRSSLPPRQRGA